MAEESGTGQVEGLRQEEEIMKLVLGRLIPNRHDLMMMLVIALILGVVFWAGWEMNPTYSCKVWLGNELRNYYMNESINFCNSTSQFNITDIS